MRINIKSKSVFRLRLETGDDQIVSWRNAELSQQFVQHRCFGSSIQEDQSIQVRSSSRLIVIGNADFIRDECLNRSLPDTNFLLLCINWLSERQTLLAIPPKETPIYTLDLKPGQLDQIVLIVVAGIPMLAAVFGVLVWTARRR